MWFTIINCCASVHFGAVSSTNWDFQYVKLPEVALKRQIIITMGHITYVKGVASWDKQKIINIPSLFGIV